MGSFGNSLKTVVLLALLTALLLWVGRLLGGIYGLIIALFFVLLLNGITYWFSDRIVLTMYRAEELPKSHHITRMVQQLARQAGLPDPRVYRIPGHTPNAFATGRSPKRSAVAVTDGIVQLLTERELKGVLAHELSHIKNRDTLIQTVAAVIAGVIGYVASMAQWFVLFGGRDDDSGSLIGLLVLAIVTPLMATLLQLALSRTREFIADESAALLVHDSKGLADALRKLESGNEVRPLRHGNPATAGLFIVNPFRGRALLELLSTHPRTEKRITRLEALRV